MWRQQIFQKLFSILLEWRLVCCDSNYTEIYSQGSNQPQARIALVPIYVFIPPLALPFNQPWVQNFAEISGMDINHDDVIKWKYFPRYWPFMRGIYRSPVNSPQKGQWRGALVFTLICARINGWVNNPEAGDLPRHITHYNVIVMETAVIPMR